MAITLGLTNSSGVVTMPGLPFGEYDVCAEYQNGSGVWFHSASVDIDNRDPLGAPRGTGITPTTLAIPNSPSGGNGQCARPS